MGFSVVTEVPATALPRDQDADAAPQPPLRKPAHNVSHQLSQEVVLLVVIAAPVTTLPGDQATATAPQPPLQECPIPEQLTGDERR